VIFAKDSENSSAAEAITSERANVGETLGMKWHKNARNILLAMMALAGLGISGCGGSSSANQVTVTVSDEFSVMVPTQTQTITATVMGATDVSSTFACTYTTTPNPTTTTPTPTPSAAASCDSAKTATGDPAVGALSNIQNTSTTVASTATFTAPKVFPDQVKLPNVQVTITATSNADKRRTGTLLTPITFDSGIRVHLVPATATLATNSTQLFLAEDFNNIVISPDQVTWGVTFEVTATTKSADCSAGSNSCGSIDATGLYKAPAAVPTAAPSSTTTPVNAAGIVTVFAFSKVDNARIAQASVTIVTAGDITFSGTAPSVAPQGGLQQDIFLSATNANSQIGVSLAPAGVTCPNPACVALDPAQIKVVFAAGSTSTSIGARARLNSEILKTPGHYTVQVTTSNTSVKVTGGPFPLDIVPVRPTIVGSTPDDFEEATLGQTGGLPFTIDGGFFGPSDSPTVATNFNGQALLTNSSTQATSTARRLSGFLPAPTGTGHTAGLYSFGVNYTTSPGPFPPPTATTAFANVAVLPDYGVSNKPLDISNAPLTLKPVPSPAPANPPVIYCPSSAPIITTPPSCAPPTPLVSFGASSAPSSIAIDRTDSLAVVTLAGVSSNNVQFIDLSTGTPTVTGQFSSGGNLATGVAVDEHLHVAAVVNYASRSLSVLSIPAGALLATVDLSNVIPQPVPPDPSFVEPFPYSVGVDPFTDRAVVAFASTNVGLIINLDPNFAFNSNTSVPPQCILPGPASAPKYCPIGYVTLGSGANPQVAFEPGARLAYVTPGGAGLLSAVDLSNASKGSLGVPITSATRASNVVTIATSSAHNLNSGNPGTVLISGLPAGTTNKTNFNGSFSVGAVLDSTHFQYFQADKDDTTTCTGTCLASSGNPFLTYTISPSIVGVAVNPVTRQLVLADPNVTNSQIIFIDPRSESISPMTLVAESTGQVTTGGPELGAETVAFQPFSNTAVSFNPKTNEVSLLDPSLLQRPAIVTTGQTGLATGCTTNPPPPSPPCTFTSPTNVTNITIPGAIAVDSVNNLVLTLNSGGGTITGFKLGTIKSVHIESVQTPPIDAGNTNITTPASLSPAVKITLGTAPTAVTNGVKILGTGFDSGSQVLLDATPFASSTLGNFSFVSSREIDVTIPVSVLNAGPRHYALSVTNSSGVSSNVSDFTVLEEIPLASCSGTGAAPGGVAIDEVHNLAAVTNTGSGCNQVSVFSLNPANIFNQTVKTIATGATPTGVAVIPSLAYIGQPAGTSGVAVVTNNGSNTVSLLDLVNAVPVLDNTKTPPAPIVVSVGTNPSGVAIDQETNLAVVANTGSNTVNTIDLTPIAQDPSNPSKTIGTLTTGLAAVDQNPIAVAIDPDRGTSRRGLAVVTCQSASSTNPFASLVGVDIGSTTPVRATSGSTTLTSTPTGIVFDPSVVTNSTNPGLFYAVSTQGNVITTFNPDTTQTQSIKVGISPNAIAFNFQTGTILTVNSLSNTISIVDSQTFSTKATLGIGGTSNFAAAIQTFTNLAVIADHDNNRVLLFPLPK
jgi:DNA-binding beta-propeller fold protein YncE